MRKLVFLFSLVLAFNSFAQEKDDVLLLSRYVWNYVDFDSTVNLLKDNPDFLIRKSKFSNRYRIQPVTKNDKAKLYQLDKRGNLVPITVKVLSPRSRVTTHYPMVEGKYDVSLGIENLKIRITQEGHDSEKYGKGVATHPLTKFDMRSYDTVAKRTTFSGIEDYILRKRPSSVMLTNLTAQTPDLKYTIKDSVRIRFFYPEGNPESWCQPKYRDTMLISGANFKEKNIDTLSIKGNICLYLRFDDSGTENEFFITEVRTNKHTEIRERCCGAPVPLFNVGEKKGLFRVFHTGDGYSTGELFINIE